MRRIVDGISETVSEVRGASFLRPVNFRLLTRTEMAAYLASTLEEEKDEFAKVQELYITLELLDPSVELCTLYLELLGEQVLGLFNLETEQLLVVGDSLPLDGLGKMTMAHELVHALQQQRFDARSLVDEAEANQDQAMALLALLEGDATVSALLYILHLSPIEIADLLQKVSTLGSPEFDGAPPFIRKTLLFPYEAGAEFLSAIQPDLGIWRAVNDVYKNPPVSTEQILHPSKYKAGETPIAVTLPPEVTSLGDGWDLLQEDVLGEFFLRTYLESALARPEAVRAAGGWGGDRFQLLGDSSGRRLFIASIVWDSTADAQEFFGAYQKFTDQTRKWTSKDADGDAVVWHATDRSVLLRVDNDRTFISIAPDAETVELIASLFP